MNNYDKRLAKKKEQNPGYEDYSLQVFDNHGPITLVWEDDYVEEMPILRSNWMELSQNYAVYYAKCVLELEGIRNDRIDS